VRIAVLAHNLRVAGGLSVGQNVVASLQRVGRQHEYLFVLPAGAGYEPLVDARRDRLCLYRRGGGLAGQAWFEAVTLPRLVRAFRPDVVWGLGNFGLPRPAAPQAVLCQNAHLVDPRPSCQRETLKFRAVNALARRRLRRSLPATRLVFCQTETMGRALRSYYGYGGRLALMPNAVSRAAVADSQEAPEVFGRLRGRFVLFCLSKYYAHKNLEILAEVFERYGDELADVALILTVRADQHPRAGRFVRRIAAGNLPRFICNVGPIPQHQIGAYFRHADALILPTLLESFSATYLEAMQFDTPILTSDRDFAREICGDAALYFDPLSAASVRDAITALRDRTDLRERLVAAGRHRRRQYVREWDDIVREALAEVESLAAAPRSDRLTGDPR